MFKPMNTSDDDTAKRKVLLYGHHGWGKTTQLKYFQEENLIFFSFIPLLN